MDLKYQNLGMILLGLILGPLIRRSAFLVEFLYAYDIARWGHLAIVRWGMGDKKKKKGKGKDNKDDGRKKDAKPGGHSDTLGQRVEVVPGRVYVHIVPM